MNLTSALHTLALITAALPEMPLLQRILVAAAMVCFQEMRIDRTSDQ
ncbi:hypothetical protein ACFRJ9_21605 [Paenarthrobacter sp. NPDC056912]